MPPCPVPHLRHCAAHCPRRADKGGRKSAGRDEVGDLFGDDEEEAAPGTEQGDDEPEYDEVSVRVRERELLRVGVRVRVPRYHVCGTLLRPVAVWPSYRRS